MFMGLKHPKNVNFMLKNNVTEPYKLTQWRERTRASPKWLYLKGASSVRVFISVDTLTIVRFSACSGPQYDEATTISSPICQFTLSASVMSLLSAVAVRDSRVHVGVFGRPWMSSVPYRTAMFFAPYSGMSRAPSRRPWRVMTAFFEKGFARVPIWSAEAAPLQPLVTSISNSNDKFRVLLEPKVPGKAKKRKCARTVRAAVVLF